ncbi:MAG: hypothetical protein ISR99_02200 [Parcubacteria group bacterium]|nr:hypothetical protein [Parcubacteria group bacterium]
MGDILVTDNTTNSAMSWPLRYFLNIMFAVFFFGINWVFVGYFADALAMRQSSVDYVWLSAFSIVTLLVLELIVGFTYGLFKNQFKDMPWRLVMGFMFLGVLMPVPSMYHYPAGQLGIAATIVGLILGMMTAKAFGSNAS